MISFAFASHLLRALLSSTVAQLKQLLTYSQGKVEALQDEIFYQKGQILQLLSGERLSKKKREWSMEDRIGGET